MKFARIALAVLFMGGTACSSLQTVKDPAQYLATRPDLVVVHFTDNSEVPISQPQMHGDSIVGTWAGLNEPFSAPMDQVKRVDAIQKDPKKTALFVVGVGTIGTLMGYGFTRITNNTGVVCSWDRGVDDRGIPGELGGERCFSTR